MQDEECLNASKQNMCWAPCLLLSIAWRVITSREILTNNLRMNRVLDEPPCRASMKNSGNKRMIERKRSWKHRVKPCDDLEGATKWVNFELRARKMNRILDEPPCRASMKNSGNERMVERKRSWKHKVKPCDDLDGASWWYNRENLELRKENMNTRTENYFIMNNLRKKELITWMKQE